MFSLILPLVTSDSWIVFVSITLIASTLIHLAGDAFELFAGHTTEDSARTAHEIVRGRYQNLFWLGAVLLGSIVPILCALLLPTALMPIAGLLALAGVFIGQHIWVRAPQQIPLS